VQELVLKGSGFIGTASWEAVLFFYIQIGLQVLYVFLEGLHALRRDLADGLRIVIFKRFDDVYITGFLQLVDLYAEVTCRRIGLFPVIRMDTTANRS
jgi:hypothetical protein